MELHPSAKLANVRLTITEPFASHHSRGVGFSTCPLSWLWTTGDGSIAQASFCLVVALAVWSQLSTF